MRMGSQCSQARAVAPGDSARGRVLLAEDDSEFRAMLASVLRHDGYEVIEAASGSELLRHFSATILWPERFRTPDVVVSDVRMPGPDGLAVLRGLRQFEWDNPVILITAFGDAATHAAAADMAAAVLDKPFNIDDLRALLAAALAEDAPRSGRPSAA